MFVIIQINIVNDTMFYDMSMSSSSCFEGKTTTIAYGHLDVRVKFSPVYRNACSKVFGCRQKDDIKKLSIGS